MAAFVKVAKTPHGLWEVAMSDDGDLSFSASGNEVGDTRKGRCCPFCSGSKAAQRTMPAMVRSADIVGAVRTGCALQVLYMPFMESDGKARRQLRRTPWLEFDSTVEASSAQQSIRQANCWAGQNFARRLLVLLNPVSGRGRSKAIWESVKGYICDAAGIECNVIESEGPNHLGELMTAMDLAQVHGIVIVGGDGTAHEVLQGMLGRADWSSVIKIPLAQIPSGSGNALCASLRITDPTHAAFIAIKGCCRSMDAATMIQAPNKRRFSFLTLTTGLLANLDYGTNHLRWMGELRFTLGALFEIFAKRTSSVKIRYLPQDCVNIDGMKSPDWELNTPQEDRLGRCDPPYGPTCSILQSLPGLEIEHLEESLLNTSFPPEWKELGPSYVQLCVAANIPWISTSYNLAPPARISDGAYTLMWTTEATRLQGIEFLLKSEKGKHLDLPFLHHEKVVALLFEPISRDSWELVDGELVPLRTTYVEVHAGLLNVMVDPKIGEGVNNAPDVSSYSLLV